MLIWCLSILLVIATHVYANDDTVRPENVLSVVTADLNGDNLLDRALLIASEDGSADLLIYLAESFDTMRLAVRKKKIVWVLTLAGTEPTLAITGRGSLVISSGNEDRGAFPWSNHITVVYRNNAFVVAGYTYTERSKEDPSYSASCDINFLTGKGVVDKKPIVTSPKAVPLTDWPETALAEGCSR